MAFFKTAKRTAPFHVCCFVIFSIVVVCEDIVDEDDYIILTDAPEEVVSDSAENATEILKERNIEESRTTFSTATIFEEKFKDSLGTSQFIKTDIFEQVSQNNGLPTCNDDQLLTYLAELQVINPESIIGLTSQEEPEELCPRISSQIDTINSYLTTCQAPSDSSNLYLQLIKGVKALDYRLCQDEDFKKEFKNIWPCFHEIKDEFVECVGPDDWTEILDNEVVCRSFEDITNCFYKKVGKYCGKEAACKARNLATAVISNVLTVNCDSFGVKIVNLRCSSANPLSFYRFLCILMIVILCFFIL